MKKRIVCILLCMAIFNVSLVTTGCSGAVAAAETATEPVYEELKVSMERPCVDSISNYSEFIGTVDTSDTVNVIPLVSGEITEKYFEVGDYVNEGDLLFTIDDTQVKQGIATAKAAYQSTKSTTNSVLGTTLDKATISATSAYKNAEIGLDTAQYSLDDLKSKIGDLDGKISDLEGTRDTLNDRIQDITCQLNMASMIPAMAAVAKDLQGELAAAQAEMAQIGASIESLKSSRESLQSNVHLYENQVKTAQVGMDIAAVSLAETVTKGIDESVDTVNSSLNQAQVAINNASESLKYYSVKSPVSGRIDAINIEKYGMAQAGNPSYVITTDETKKAVFYVSEANINKISVGQPLTAEYSGVEYTGVVSDIEDSVDSQTGLFKIEASFNGDTASLYKGASTKIRILSDNAESVLTLPLDAIYYENEKAFVYIEQNGIAKKTFVETGLYDSEKIQIISGVDQDTNVITTWSARLKDGEKVNGVN